MPEERQSTRMEMPNCVEAFDSFDELRRTKQHFLVTDGGASEDFVLQVPL